jgi:hypothetical protein
MFPKLPECPGLAEAVADLRAKVKASSEAANAQNDMLKAEAEKLLITKQELTGRADALHRQAAFDRASAEQWHVDRVMLDSIAARIAGIETGFAEPDWSGVGHVMQIIVAHYTQHLPTVLAGHFVATGVCDNIATAEQLVKFTDAALITTKVNAVVANMASGGFGRGHWATCNKIFDRALRGQVHLGVDLPESKQQ